MTKEQFESEKFQAYLDDVLQDTLEDHVSFKQRRFKWSIKHIIQYAENLAVKQIQEIIKERISDRVEATQLCEIIEGAIITYPIEEEIIAMQGDDKGRYAAYEKAQKNYFDRENAEGHTYEDWLLENYVVK